MKFSKCIFILISMIVCFIFDTDCTVDIPTCISRLQNVYGNFDHNKANKSLIHCIKYALLHLTRADVERSNLNFDSKKYYEEMTKDGDRITSSSVLESHLFCYNQGIENRSTCNKQQNQNKKLSISDPNLTQNHLLNFEGFRYMTRQRDIANHMLIEKKIMYTTDGNGNTIEDPAFKYLNLYLRQAHKKCKLNKVVPTPVPFCEQLNVLYPDRV